MSQDFSLLYFQLGLEPGCSLDDLKRAYRVRVAELHPDRHNDAAASDEDHEALTELTALYSKAIRFHRIHGRLPGAAPKSTGSHTVHVAQPAPASRSSHEHTPASTRADWSASRAEARRNASNRSTPTLAIVTILVLVVVMIVLHWSETSFEQKVQEGLHAQEAAEPAYDPQQPRLVLGMEEGAVFAIEGAPVVVQDDIWNYGSSWVRFEDGHLVDWSSAPPNRLSTATPRPVSEEEAQEQAQ
ncbi:MAG TPA: J domain-containing protein [Lysobacter sp.]